MAAEQTNHLSTKSRDIWSLRFWRYLPQTTVKKEEAAACTCQRRHKKQDGPGIVFFTKEQSNPAAMLPPPRNATLRRARQIILRYFQRKIRLIAFLDPLTPSIRIGKSGIAN